MVRLRQLVFSIVASGFVTGTMFVYLSTIQDIATELQNGDDFLLHGKTYAELSEHTTAERHTIDTLWHDSKHLYYPPKQNMKAILRNNRSMKNTKRAHSIMRNKKRISEEAAIERNDDIVHSIYDLHEDMIHSGHDFGDDETQDKHSSDNIKSVGNDDTWNLDKSKSNKTGSYTFTPINNGYMKSFRYVCIERDDKQGQNKIVVYRSQVDEVVHYDLYDITFSQRNMPSTHTLITEHAAYVVVFRGTESFFHHYEDVIVDIYYLLKKTGRLNSSIKNQLYFFHNDLDEDFKQFYTHKFLMELPIRPDYFAIDRMHATICYTDVALSLGMPWYIDARDQTKLNIPKLTARTEVTQYLKQKLHLGESCSDKDEIVILDRQSQRSMLNSVELLRTAQLNGFRRISIVYFEYLNVLEQAEVMSCTRILILVQGSALIWIPFMPPNSAVIEISWPQKNWIFHANYMFAKQPYLSLFKLQIPTEDLYPDMGRFHVLIYPEKRTKKYYEKMLNEWPEDPFLTNPYKFAHCLVDKEEFLKVLNQADSRLKSNYAKYQNSRNLPVHRKHKITDVIAHHREDKLPNLPASRREI